MKDGEEEEDDEENEDDGNEEMKDNGQDGEEGESEEAKIEFHDKNCQNKHFLTKVTKSEYNEATIPCDLCGKEMSISKSSPCFGCSKCEYDICVECYTNKDMAQYEQKMQVFKHKEAEAKAQKRLERLSHRSSKNPEQHKKKMIKTNAMKMEWEKMKDRGNRWISFKSFRKNYYRNQLYNKRYEEGLKLKQAVEI